MKFFMNKLLFLVTLSLLIFLFSCQKEVTSDSNNSNNTPTNNLIDSNYIDKIYQIDMTGGVYDTLGIWLYNYDNLKRVQSMVLQSIDPAITDGISYSYFYYNQDTLPYKTVSTETSSGIANTITHFHFWDAIGKNLQDSSIYSNAGASYYVVRSYSYGSNMIYGSQYASFSGPVINLTQRDTATTDIYGNILASKKYHLNSLTNNWELTSTTNYTLDAFTSPFSILTNFKTFGVFPSGETLYYELPAVNNYINQTEVNSIETGSPNTNTYTYNNTYNSKNQLKELLIHGTHSSSTPDDSKFIFTYKHL